ncbi:hypothetical protein ACF0H5_012357 [Mactra antiquata]
MAIERSKATIPRMERVTLGIVGDPYVGKTMLSVSYTSNYVFKEYKPTVLNCYSTTLEQEGHVIDLLIWDNSGSDEYSELRPLSYQQTDAFLLCFSLKSRESLENVLTKWLPEIDDNVSGRVPIVLVGCKRDDCLKSSTDNLDTVSTEEGEDMASCVGAIKYAETSAIEQSGFTSAFNSAIMAGLARRKRCTL